MDRRALHQLVESVDVVDETCGKTDPQGRPWTPELHREALFYALALWLTTHAREGKAVDTVARLMGAAPWFDDERATYTSAGTSFTAGASDGEGGGTKPCRLRRFRRVTRYKFPPGASALAIVRPVAVGPDEPYDYESTETATEVVGHGAAAEVLRMLVESGAV